MRLTTMRSWMGWTAIMAAGYAGDAWSALTMSSPAFENGGEIPRVLTCEGDDSPPALSWREVPTGTQSLVLIVEDPDAPDPAAPKLTWVHWVLYDIPPAAPGLEPGALPDGTREGLNSWKRIGYGGPCPPIGRHRYFHKLYALDIALPGLERPTKDDLERAMAGHVLEHAELIGTYRKREP